MSVIKPILHDRRANCWLLPLYRKGYPQKQFAVNIMVNPSTHIMRCNKLIIFVGSYIHPQKKRFIERGNMVARLWMKVRSMNETVAKVNHMYYTRTGVFTSYTQRSDYMNWFWNLALFIDKWLQKLTFKERNCVKNKNWSHSHFWRR